MKSTERLNRRYVFVNNNMSDILKLEKGRTVLGWYAFTKNPLVNDIAAKARRYIGYSDKTNDCDIVWTLFCLALDLHKENIRYQLKSQMK